MSGSDLFRITQIDFGEVYRRHLGRHSESGINVLHLVAVYGVYHSVFSLASAAVSGLIPNLRLIDHGLTLFVLSAPWLVILFMNVPAWPFVLSILSAVALSIANVLAPLPWWLAGLLLPVWHQLQQLSHRWYTVSRDMSRYQERYPKGARLVVMLAIFELPILLNYFLEGDTEREV